MRAALFNVDGWMWRGRVSCISGRASATHRQKMQTQTFNDDACGVGGRLCCYSYISNAQARDVGHDDVEVAGDMRTRISDR